MEPVTNYRLSVSVLQEPAALSDDDRDTSPSRKHHKAKHKRKVSTISLRDNEKAKSRASKGRASLSPVTQEIPEAIRLARTRNAKPSSGDHLSTFEESQVDHEDNSNEAAQNLSQLTINEKGTTQSLEKNEAAGSPMDEYKKNVIDLINKHKASLPKEEEEKNVDLEDKLAQDHEFDVIGIMNLASTNLTDNDMPMIIQRAFCEKKKCRGLILRDNALTSAGVKMLVDAAISMRTNLRYLSFSDNKDIGDEGIEHVIRLLQKSRSMTFLAIPNTGMTDRGVRLLADLLCGVDADSQCAPLEKLYISFNKSITDESLDAVLQILGQNQTLKVFSIQHCSFSDKARRQLRQVGTKMKKRKFSLAE